MRRIKKAKIKFLSLVPKGANGLETIYKGDALADGTFPIGFSMLVKASTNFDEQGELLAVVYAPELRDSQGDIASADVIKSAMYDAAKDGVNIDVRHNEEALPKSKAYVAESFIIQKGDPRFSDFKNYAGNAVDVTGGWGVVMKIEDAELRKSYRDKKWDGISMGGVAAVEVEKSTAPDHAQMIMDALAAKLNLKNVSIYGSINMTGQELADTLKANNAELTKGIVTGLSEVLAPLAKAMGVKEVKKEETTTEVTKAAPVLKGPITAENLRKHKIELRRAAIAGSIDWTDAESVNKAETDLAELDKEVATAAAAAKGELTADELAAGIQKDDTAEVRDLKTKLAKAQGRSNQTQEQGEQEGEKYVGMNKEDARLAKLGEGIAEAANRSRPNLNAKK